MATLDHYDSVRLKTPTKQIQLSDFAAAIRSNSYEHVVKSVRDAIGKEDKVRLKGTLPAVTLSGYLTSGQRAGAAADGRFAYNGLLQIDIDGHDNPGKSAADMRDIVKNDELVRLGFISPSGDGLKLVLSVPIVNSPDRFRAVWLAAERHFKQYGLIIDGAAKDPGRLCFYSHDRDAWEHPEKKDAVLCVESYLSPEEEAEFTPQGSTVGSLRALTLSDLQDIIDALPSEPPPYQQWWSWCSSAWAEFGESATPMLMKKWPEQRKGEYASKFATRGTHFTIGTLIHAAKQHGYVPPKTFALGSLQNFGAVLNSGIDYAPYIFAGHRGLADAYDKLVGGTVLYSDEEKVFRIYKNGVWERDRVSAVKNDIQVSLQPVLKATVVEVMGTVNPKDKLAVRRVNMADDLVASISNMQTLNRITENLTVKDGVSVTSDRFNTKHHLLCIKNGVVDFNKAIVRQFDKDDMLTAKSNFYYDPEATCPNFDQFLEDITVGDQDLIAHLWELFSHCCTGEVDNDALSIFYGGGRNGKSTLTSTLAELLGPDLATTVSSDLMFGHMSSSEAMYSKASLENKRLVLVDELAPNHKLKSAELKKLIGGDSIQIRNPYEKSRVVKSTFTCILCSNFKPEVATCDEGTWRRLKLIPFKADFKHSKSTLTRSQRVAMYVDEAAGILNKILAARVEFLNRGRVPYMANAVDQSSEAYRENEDQVASFVKEQMTDDADSKIPLGDVRMRYISWVETELGEPPHARSARKLRAAFERLGYEVRASNGNVVYLFGLKFHD